MKRCNCEVGASPHPPYRSRAAIRADAASIAVAGDRARTVQEEKSTLGSVGQRKSLEVELWTPVLRITVGFN